MKNNPGKFNLHRKSALLPLSILMLSFSLAGCGRKDSSDTVYEIVDGKVVEVTVGDNLPDNYDGDGLNVYSGIGNRNVPGEYTGNFLPDSASGNSSFEYNGASAASESNTVTAGQAGGADEASVNDGISYYEGEDSSTADLYGLTEALKVKLGMVCDACRGVYIAADKGTTMNITLSLNDISQMITAIGSAGYCASDSNGNFNMTCSEQLDEFGNAQAQGRDDVRGTYFTVYPDGHISGFTLSRESGKWQLYAASAAWNDDYSIRIYSEGRYAAGNVKYTEKGWLIYTRNTDDYGENLNTESDSYIMVRVLPYDSEKRTLCEKYVEPVGYFENNLFTSSWTEADLGVIDFNSLYAYIFGMYNGTDMLSSYNSRTYYKSVQGTKLYLIPQDIFENNVGVYFNIDKYALRNISDYSSQLGGYFFLGYSYDYYNVTPKTPEPEVVSYTYNSNGTITMIVDAVNKWYGTDRAFRHELTVRPGSGAAFQYVSNTLYESEDNILPAQKLSEMLNVELTNTSYG